MYRFLYSFYPIPEHQTCLVWHRQSDCRNAKIPHTDHDLSTQMFNNLNAFYDRSTLSAALNGIDVSGAGLAPPLRCAFSPDGALLATASWDQTIRLWDVGAATHTGKVNGDIRCISTLIPTMFEPGRPQG